MQTGWEEAPHDRVSVTAAFRAAVLRAAGLRSVGPSWGRGLALPGRWPTHTATTSNLDLGRIPEEVQGPTATCLCNPRHGRCADRLDIRSGRAIRLLGVWPVTGRGLSRPRDLLARATGTKHSWRRDVLGKNTRPVFGRRCLACGGRELALPWAV